MSFRQKLVWLCSAALCVLLTMVAFAPASWVDTALQSQTDGRLALGDVQGSLWNGSAFIGVSAARNGDLSPLLPGRFTWHLSPILLLGQIELTLENGSALRGPLHVTGNLRHVQVDPGGVMLPSERLAGLGAPLNTLKPSGEIVLSWDSLSIERQGQVVDVDGTMKLTMENMASALSPVRPLGSYLLSFVWHGQHAAMDLKTTQGPMSLSGSGALDQGNLRFSGEARAQDGQEDRLENLLNLLGQRKPGIEKTVIALEFK
jgi:general secretion pathway protein N